MINNTMLVQIAALAWLLLGKRIGGQELSGISLVVLGTLLVQFCPSTAPRGLLTMRRKSRFGLSGSPWT